MNLVLQHFHEQLMLLYYGILRDNLLKIIESKSSNLTATLILIGFYQQDRKQADIIFHTDVTILDFIIHAS